jgi:hypothetical protein
MVPFLAIYHRSNDQGVSRSRVRILHVAHLRDDASGFGQTIATAAKWSIRGWTYQL